MFASRPWDKTILYYPIDYNASYMNLICFALYKDAIRELDADEFFEIPQLYVRRIEDDVDARALVSFYSPFIHHHFYKTKMTLFTHFLYDVFVILVSISRLR